MYRIGAHTIISQLNTSRSITKLKLNSNRLGDDGVSALFTFLKSPAALRHRSSITEIYLNNNGVGCRGLRDIADYMNGNEVVLKTLWLANVSDHSSFGFVRWMNALIEHDRT
jgi:hypothetical protein